MALAYLISVKTLLKSRIAPLVGSCLFQVMSSHCGSLFLDSATVEEVGGESASLPFMAVCLSFCNFFKHLFKAPPHVLIPHAIIPLMRSHGTYTYLFLVLNQVRHELCLLERLYKEPHRFPSVMPEHVSRRPLRWG